MTSRLSILAKNCSWDTWNVTWHDVCKECRKARVDQPSIPRSKNMYANATFGGTCEIEEPKLFKCEPDFWKEEACQMSNELICFTEFGEIQYFILPSKIL